MMKAMVYRGGDLGNAFEVKEIKRPIPKAVSYTHLTLPTKA